MNTRRFYITVDRQNGFEQYADINNPRTTAVKFRKDQIYYLAKEYVNRLQGYPLEVFGSENFNLFNDSISITALHEYPPLTPPANQTWHIISNKDEEVYNNTVEITLDANTQNIEIGDWVTAENGATGKVKAVSILNFTIAYNSIDFSESAGSNKLTKGRVYDSGTYDTITDEDGTPPVKTRFSEFAAELAYYDGNDTDNPWRYFHPFRGFKIDWNSNTYIWGHDLSDDFRWRKEV